MYSTSAPSGISPTESTMESRFRSINASVFAVLLVLVLILVSAFAARADASVSDTWDNVKNSEAVQQVQKEWSRARSKTQSFINKASNGKLADDITSYIDNALMKLFGIRVSELHKTLKKAQHTWLGPTVTGLWILLGYVTFKMTSFTSCLIIMSMTLLLHSIYGSIMVLTQVVIFIGLSMYFVSLIANNMVLSAVTILTVYVAYFIFGLCRRVQSQSMLYDLEDRVADVGQKVCLMEGRMEIIDQKLDQLLEARD